LWYSILQQTSKRIHKIDNHIFNKFYKNELFHQKSHIHRTFITYLTIRCFGTKVSTKNTSELTGQVSDISNNKGLSFASVTLLKKEGEKTQLTAGATADENGNFKLSNVPLGEFVLRVSFISYKTFEKAIKVEQSHQNIETIFLSPDANVLQEVQVKGEKDAASFNMDKRVFSVGKNLTSIGGTAEAL
jgi:hypothetical protein